MKGIIERALASIDIETITTDVMSKLVISKLEMYFVVRDKPGEVRDEDSYEIVGMTYSERAAKQLWLESSKAQPCKIFQFDMGALVKLVEKFGAAKEIT